MADKDWPQLYADYLRSQEWADRRARVMERAGYRCEGCRDRNATEVHHLSYDNVTREFLFELVALCGECHERIHTEEMPPRPKASTWTPRHSNSSASPAAETPGARARRLRLGELAAAHRAKTMGAPLPDLDGERFEA